MPLTSKPSVTPERTKITRSPQTMSFNSSFFSRSCPASSARSNSSALPGAKRPCMCEPKIFTAQAVTIPSGQPPTPSNISTPLSPVAAATAIATSPSLKLTQVAPVASTSSMTCLLRGLLITATRRSVTAISFAAANAKMFSSVDMSMSQTPIPSAPVTNFFI